MWASFVTALGRRNAEHPLAYASCVDVGRSSGRSLWGFCEEDGGPCSVMAVDARYD